jgi:hypothetical protein
MEMGWADHVRNEARVLACLDGCGNSRPHQDLIPGPPKKIIIIEVTAKRPDIIIKNNKQKTCTLIDVAIPADRNVVQNEAEKKLNTRTYA